jgi:hypothetical protein
MLASFMLKDACKQAISHRAADRPKLCAMKTEFGIGDVCRRSGSAPLSLRRPYRERPSPKTTGPPKGGLSGIR